jgi:hypothetical protein
MYIYEIYRILKVMATTMAVAIITNNRACPADEAAFIDAGNCLVKYTYTYI